MSEECMKYFSRISEYLDGELDEAVCRKIETHLQDCPECRDCIETLKKTIQLCRDAGEETVPEDFRARMMAELRACLGQGRGEKDPQTSKSNEDR